MKKLLVFILILLSSFAFAQPNPPQDRNDNAGDNGNCANCGNPVPISGTWLLLSVGVGFGIYLQFRKYKNEQQI